MQSDSLDNCVATKSDIVELKSTLEELGQSVDDVKRRTANLVKRDDVRIVRQGLEKEIVDALTDRVILIGAGIAIVNAIWGFFV